MATRLGRYIILDLLGSGGMGLVYSAFDPQLDRRVAVKVLRMDVGDAADRQRLLREAKAMARLAHPNVVVVYDAGEEGGQTYVAMEFVRGSSLRRWLAEPHGWQEIVAVFLQAGSGLQAAHEVGLVHRDFKPDNVLLTESGDAKVADFGLARGGDATAVDARSIGDADTINASRLVITRDGMLVGTPAYMSPEQFVGGAADARSDQFSFFVALYEALHGHLPFDGQTLHERAANVTSGHRTAHALTATVPRWIDDILDRGLRARREDRYPTMKAALEALRAAVDHKPGRWRRRLLYAIGSVALLAVIAAGVQVWIQRALDARRGLCAGAVEALVGAWDADRRRDVERAFLATGAPYAADAWRRVSERLDAHTELWASMYTEACQATHLRGEQSEALLDLRMACLQRRRLEVKSLVDVFVRGDAGVVEHAVEALDRLSDLGPCGDSTALLAVSARSTNHTPAALEVRELMAQARAMEATANYQPALDVAVSASAKAVALDDKSLVAESLLTEGAIRGELGDQQAENRLSESFYLAEELDDTVIAAQAALDLMYHATYRLDVVVAERWERHARALTRRLTDEERPEHRSLAASYSSHLGTLRTYGDHLAEAQEVYLTAIREIEALPGDNRVWLAGLHNNLGNVHVRRGDLESAARELETSARVYKDVLGEYHPSYAVALNNLGELLMRRQAWEEAKVTYVKARSILVAALGSEHPNVGVVDNNLGDVGSRLGDYIIAADYYHHAIDVFIAAFGDNAPPLAYPLTGLGEVHLIKGEQDKAREYLERALVLRGSESGPELAHTRFALARALGPDHARASELASQARESYAAGGPSYARELAEVDAWIRGQKVVELANVNSN